MTMLYLNPCYSELCYKGTALYFQLQKNLSLAAAQKKTKK